MLTLTSPVETWLHRVPAGLKLVLLCAGTILMFRVQAPAILLGILAGLAAAYLGFGRSFLCHGVRMLQPLWPFVVVVSIWHVWIGAPQAGLAVIFRLVTAVAMANLVTMTTRLCDIIDIVQHVTGPLRHVGLKPKVIALAIALAIRFIPVLSQKIEFIGLAWKSRSARRPGWRVLVPTTLAVLDDAEHVAGALRARGGVE